MRLRPPGRSLTTRLLIVLAIPLAGMALFATLWAKHHLDEARSAEAQRHQTTVAVATSELLIAVDLARTTVDLVITQTGGLQNLGPFRALVQGEVVSQARRIRAMSDRIAALPSMSSDERKCLDEITGTVASLDGVALRSGDEPQLLFTPASEAALAAASHTIEDEVMKLRGEDNDRVSGTLLALADLQRQTIRDGSLTMVMAYGGGATSRPEIRREAAAADSAHRMALMIAPPDVQRPLLEWADGDAGRGWRTFQDRVLAGSSVRLIDGVRHLSSRSGLLANVRADFGKRALGAATTRAQQARRGFDTAVLATILILLGTLALAALTLRPATRRLRRLERHALRISTGDLTVEPLAAGGRDETGLLANSFDLMSGTLTTLQRRVDALAEGTLDPDPAAENVPGRIGESIARSVARLSEMTSRLRLNEELARLTVDAAVEAIWILDDELRIVSSNPAASAISGRTPDELHGRELLGAIVVARDEQQRCERHERTNVEGRVTRPDGSSLDVLVSTRRVAPTDGAVRWMVFARDISDRKRLEARLEWEATHDALTALPNRTSLTRLLAGVHPSPAAPVTAMFIDLDGFKRVNDAMGHRMGDDVLREAAMRLKRAIRPSDTLARLGGDEFVVVVTDAIADDALDAMAGRLLREMEDPFAHDGTTTHLSASIGIASTDGDTDPTDLIRLADLAMYRAKQDGRGRAARYDASMHDSVAERMELERALRQAIVKSELVPFFQPVVDANDGHLTRVELLARWDRPGHGPVSPAQFIPLAEETGLVIDIGRWALRSAARLAHRLRQDHPGFDAPIAVNVSGMHVMRGDVIADVEAALFEAGAEPGWLSVELTETYLLDEAVEEVDDVLRRLVERGVSLSIDDFGTGYSSMTYLRRLPASVVKVDRSFVAGSEGSDADLGIVELVTTLAHSLQMTVVAEGVETSEQLERVRAAGCDEAQGYLVARPMDVQAFGAWLVDHDTEDDARIGLPGAPPTRV